MAVPKTTTNPLEDSFSDCVIPVEELRLPLRQVHTNKHFKRCKFVGPAAIAILGGNFVRTEFVECGDLLAMDDGVNVTGVIGLRNCTVEDCQFIQTTILADQQTASVFSSVPGIRVAGLKE